MERESDRASGQVRAMTAQLAGTTLDKPDWYPLSRLPRG